MKAHGWRLAVALSSAALLVGAAVGITLAATQNSKARTDASISTRKMALAKLDRKFGVFRRGTISDWGRAHTAVAGGSLVERVQSSLASGHEQMNPSTAVGTKAGSFQVILVASSNKVGMYHQSIEGPAVIGGSSAPRGSVEEKGLWDINETPEGQVNDFGLVPNGNSSVTIKYKGGESESVPVVNNVVEVSGPRTGKAPEAATYNNAEGSPVTEQLPIPRPAPAGPGPTG